MKQKRYTLYYKMGQHVCRGSCGRWLPFALTTVDHVIPRSKGGPDALANLQIMCDACNQEKADRIVAQS